MIITAQYLGKLPNGNLSFVLNISGAAAHFETDSHGVIQPGHNLSEAGVKSAHKALKRITIATVR